jgi:hypothetical protein
LSVYENVDELEKMFSKNMFDDSELKPLLLELLGLSGHKPLDCVGTVEEIRAATRNALKDYGSSALLAGIEEDKISGRSTDELVRTFGEHAIPAEIEQPLIKMVKELLS